MAAFDPMLKSLSIHSLGLEKYGFVNETDYYETDLKSDPSPRIASQTFNTTDEGNRSLSEKLSVRNLGIEKYGFVSTPNSHLKSLCDSVFGMDKYGFIADDETYEVETTKQAEEEKQYLDSKKLSVGNLGTEKYGFVNKPNSHLKSLCDSVFGMDKYGFIADDETYEAETKQAEKEKQYLVSRKLSVENLGTKKYGSVGNPNSHLKSLCNSVFGMDKYGFIADDETYEAETTEEVDEEKQNFVSNKPSGKVGVLDFKLGSNWLQFSSGEDPDERYERLSKSLKVNIPAPEKYQGCDIEANNFLSSYYPCTTR